MHDADSMFGLILIKWMDPTVPSKDRREEDVKAFVKGGEPPCTDAEGCRGHGKAEADWTARYLVLDQ